MGEISLLTDSISNLLTSPENVVSCLSIAGGAKGQLRGDVNVFLQKVAENGKLVELDISGNDVGNSCLTPILPKSDILLGASMISRLLQTTTTLKSLRWDDNNVGLMGYQGNPLCIPINSLKPSFMAYRETIHWCTWPFQ